VLVPKDEGLLGKLVEVVITSAGKHYLKCSVLCNVQSLNVPSPLPKGQISGLQATQLVGCSVFFNAGWARKVNFLEVYSSL